MTNWSSFAGLVNPRVTTWNYDPYRGWLTSKQYDDGHGPAYSYTPAGRLASRLWARGTNTAYVYDGAGTLTNTSYNDGATPAVSHAYDREGRQTNITQTYPDTSTVSCTLAYNALGSLISETWAGGPLNGISITNGYDNLLRRTNLVSLNTGILTATTYGYDAASRLSRVLDGTNSATYSYVANSPLVSQIKFTNGTSLRMTTTKTYDYLNRLTSIGSVDASSNPLDAHNYSYNNANQRTSVTNTDGTYWQYGYDALGQVASGIKHWSDGSVVAGQQFGYAFDDIGNRMQTSAGGDQWGANLRYANYTANDLNQYTSRTVPGAVDIIGSATNTATVRVNNQATYRHGNYYRTQLSIDNTFSAVFQAVTNLAVTNMGTSFTVSTNVNGSTYIPNTPENFSYNSDGNLTNDGRWAYVWDAENRLVIMTNNNPVGPQMGILFFYDAMNRRIGKTVIASVTTNTFSFVYEGWNLIGELTNSTILRSYDWGIDLNGSINAAGGVGGLLVMTYHGAQTTNCFAAFDGNGNVSSLISASNAVSLATYEYGPFGEVIRTSGLTSQVNPFKFSTKYHDDDTDLLYFGHRYLNATTRSWLNRDPMEERGGNNLYGCNGNDNIDYNDFLGLTWKINRKCGKRAHVTPDIGDTVSGLASQIKFDDKDFKSWLTPIGPTKMPMTPSEQISGCSEFTIPNTIFIDMGQTELFDYLGTIVHLWRIEAYLDMRTWLREGYLVALRDNVTDAQVTTDLGSKDIFGYQFIGHGWSPGIINTYDSKGSDQGVTPDRYTSFGIAFATLKACSSADKLQPSGGHYKYNAWESNVSTRGRFAGYEGDTDILNEVANWRTTHGKNDGGVSTAMNRFFKVNICFLLLGLIMIIGGITSCHPKPPPIATRLRLKEVYWRLNLMNQTTNNASARLLRCPGNNLQDQFLFLITEDARAQDEDLDMVRKTECFDVYGNPFNIDFRTNLIVHGIAPHLLSGTNDLIIWSSGPNGSNEFGFNDDISLWKLDH